MTVQEKKERLKEFVKNRRKIVWKAPWNRSYFLHIVLILPKGVAPSTNLWDCLEENRTSPWKLDSEFSTVSTTANLISILTTSSPTQREKQKWLIGERLKGGHAVYTVYIVFDEGNGKENGNAERMHEAFYLVSLISPNLLLVQSNGLPFCFQWFLAKKEEYPATWNADVGSECQLGNEFLLCSLLRIHAIGSACQRVCTCP